MKTSHILAACGALAFALQMSPAAADDGSWYLGAGGGATRYNIPGQVDLSSAGTSTTPAYQATIRYQTSSAAFRFEGGYQLNDNFAVEGSYTDFGAVNAYLDLSTPLVFSDSGHVRVRTWTADVVGTWPLTGWFDLFGRVGLSDYHTDFTTLTLYVQGGSTPTVTDAKFAESSATGITPTLGAGAD